VRLHRPSVGVGTDDDGETGVSEPQREPPRPTEQIHRTRPGHFAHPTLDRAQVAWIWCRGVSREPQNGPALRWDRGTAWRWDRGTAWRWIEHLHARRDVRVAGGRATGLTIVHPLSVEASAKTPPPSSAAARATMRANRRRDTGPELRLRRELHRRGLRFRVDHPPVAGLGCRADIVFTRLQIAVFVDGCFWHSCPEHGTRPTANGDWWGRKLALNVERDRRNDGELGAAGWTVIRVWEHEPPSDGADRICAAADAARATLYRTGGLSQARTQPTPQPATADRADC
jgi:DNA mismatch endonuclease (patch repair protein)